MDVLEAIRTTRAMRRLDPAREVSEADLRTIIEAATKAANGGNRQPARWLVVRDAMRRRRLGKSTEVRTFAMIPVGHPLGRWGGAPRRPAVEVTFWDRWGTTSADGSNDHV